MQAVAKLNNVPTSPRKMRVVADLIRGKKVSMALSILKFEKKHGAAKLEKLLLSAISNWQNKHEDAKLEEADLVVKEIMVDSGRMLKRLRPAPQGRAHRIRKRSNHVTLVVESSIPIEAPAKKEEKKEEKAPKKETKKAEKTEAKKKETKKAATKKKETAPKAEKAADKKKKSSAEKKTEKSDK